MNERERENARVVGSVKAAINKYGGKISFKAPDSLRKTQKHTPEMAEKPSKAPELHIAKNKIGRLNEDTKIADLEKSQAELELLNAKKTVRELTSQIQKSKLKANERNKAESIGVLEDHRYEELAREVEALKRELSKLKLDMGHTSEEKLRAEREVEAASLRLESYMSGAEQLRKEIDEANEDEVLVELARIQARKELAEIEAQRREEREKFSSKIEKTRKRISALRGKIEQFKNLEETLADTNCDVEVLQNELNLIREIDKRIEMKSADVNLEELEDLKNELKPIKGGAFQIMASMDLIRIELKEIMDEKETMQKMEEETRNSIMFFNSELLLASHKLEDVITSEEKETLILSKLNLSLDNLEKEKEAALKETKIAQDEIEKIKSEIQKTENETDIAADRLYGVMQELKAVKSAEMKALKKLKYVAENTAKTRAFAYKKKSTISISKFEYDYLTGCATGARELAEKKIAAANAWEVALRASETEMKMKIRLAESKVKELGLQEEEEIQRMEKLLNAKERISEGLQDQREQRRKSMRESIYASAASPLIRPAKYRKSLGSPMARRVNTSYSMKRRRASLLKIGKYFAGKQAVNELEVSLDN